MKELHLILLFISSETHLASHDKELTTVSKPEMREVMLESLSVATQRGMRFSGFLLNGIRIMSSVRCHRNGRLQSLIISKSLSIVRKPHTGECERDGP